MNPRSSAAYFFGELLDAASDAYLYGVSWRNFHVGVAVLARRTNSATGQYEYLVYADANNKPLQQGGHRICGEEYCCQKVRERGYDTILWMCIVAGTQPDDTIQPEFAELLSDEHHKTLKSCGYCRTWLQHQLYGPEDPKRPRLFNRHTLVSSFNIHTRDLHTYNLGWLLRHYGVPNKRWPIRVF